MLTKRSSLLFALLIFAVGAWLFYLKYTVVSIEDRIRCLNRDLIRERKNRHILRAEWKALTSPERIQRLAAKYLHMHQTEPRQLREFDPSLFHPDKSRYKNTKRLSELVEEILSSGGRD
jgi:cell division protein FtsL